MMQHNQNGETSHFWLNDGGIPNFRLSPLYRTAGLRIVLFVTSPLSFAIRALS